MNSGGYRVESITIKSLDSKANVQNIDLSPESNEISISADRIGRPRAGNAFSVP
jgi:hypothetical protein